MPSKKNIQVLTKEKLVILDKLKTLVHAYDICLDHYYREPNSQQSESRKLVINDKEWKSRFSPASFYFSTTDAAVIIGAIYFNYFLYRDRGEIGFFPENLLNISNVLWSGLVNFISNMDNKKKFNILDSDDLYNYEIAKEIFQSGSFIYFEDTFNTAIVDKSLDGVDVDAWINILKSKILTFKI